MYKYILSKCLVCPKLFSLICVIRPTMLSVLFFNVLEAMMGQQFENLKCTFGGAAVENSKARFMMCTFAAEDQNVLSTSAHRGLN